MAVVEIVGDILLKINLQQKIGIFSPNLILN
jgi:hypothetical protein